MIYKIHLSTSYLWMKRLMFLALVAYSATISVVLFRMNPTPILIGIDPFGTRIIATQEDRLLKSEKENLLKRFILQLYNYDETNFDERISNAGDLMAASLWDKRNADFSALSKRIKNEPLSQKAKILDLREIDDQHYEADLAVGIHNRLKSVDLKLRVAIELKPSARTQTKPYPYEVSTYDEQTLQ